MDRYNIAAHVIITQHALQHFGIFAERLFINFIRFIHRRCFLQQFEIWQVKFRIWINRDQFHLFG